MKFTASIVQWLKNSLTWFQACSCITALKLNKNSATVHFSQIRSIMEILSQQAKVFEECWYLQLLFFSTEWWHLYLHQVDRGRRNQKKYRVWESSSPWSYLLPRLHVLANQEYNYVAIDCEKNCSQHRGLECSSFRRNRDGICIYGRFAHPPPSSDIKWTSWKYCPVTPLQFMYASRDMDALFNIVQCEVIDRLQR